MVVAIWVEKFQSARITMTPPVFNNAARVVFLVSGREKASALQTVLEGPQEPSRFPARIIRPAPGALVYLADSAAAGQLARPTDET